MTIKKEHLIFKDNYFLFPTDEIIKSIAQEFKIENDLIFLQKTHHIGLIKTAIQNGKYKSIVIGINENRLVGFIAQNIPKTKTFNIKSLSAFHASRFEDSILDSLKEFKIKWEKENVLYIVNRVREETLMAHEAQIIEDSLSVATKTKKLKIKV
jgi:hypothetical protein